MRTLLALRTTALAIVLTVAAAPRALAAPTVMPDFVVENAVPGVRFNTPTAIAFAGDRLFVAEKGGIVWVVQNGIKLSRAFWMGDKEVLNNGDRGLVGLAVDPNFATNGYVYFFYTVDPDSNAVESETASFARLTRYRVSAADSNRVDESSRTVLIGRTWRDGFLSATLSHGAGSLRFGRDGSLLISNGDGAHYDRIDIGGFDPAQFTADRSDSMENLGAYRAQCLESMSGKILRVNPETGAGYASNPYHGEDPFAPRSRIWASGLRNPFRFCVRPGTGSPDTSLGDPGALYVGDVGLNTWEEIDLVRPGGLNFGWPCFEGKLLQPLYSPAVPARYGCETMGTASNPGTHTLPTFTWHHNDSTLSDPHGLRGNCTSGGVFYGGTLYPSHYHDRLFFSDFGRGWVRVAQMDSLDRIVQLQEFATGLEGPVDWAADPITGDIHYVSIYTGEVRRFRYVGSNGAEMPPIAYASAHPTVGPAPVTIDFSSLGSYDASGEPVTASWNFGDASGTGAGVNNPTHVYDKPGEYEAILTIATPRGAVARDTVSIVVTALPGFPTSAVLDSLGGPDRPLGAPWAGSIAGLRIERQALVQTTSSNQAIWNKTGFAANQEAYFRFDSVSATAPEHNLLLKVQGTSWNTGAIQVVYSAPQGLVVVNTYTPIDGWMRRGGPYPVSFQPGDQFGARAYSNGTVVIYRNGETIGITSVQTWRFSSGGGRIGLLVKDSRGSRLEDFGGGSVRVRASTPPTVNITQPADGSFYVDDQPIDLRLEAADAEDASDKLGFVWSVDLIHNNHTHPNVHVINTAAATFEATSHDDGTGVHYEIRAMVSDTDGLADTSKVSIYPEIDLIPGPVIGNPGPSNTPSFVPASFVIRNRGRMPSPPCHWTLLADGAALAQGDTLIAALDSVRVACAIPAGFDGGANLRIVVDSLGAIPETDETNNALAQRWTAPFPTTPVLDGFAANDGPLAAPWTGNLAGLAIAAHALVQTTTTSYATWNGPVLGTDQEAYLRLDAITATAPEHDLLLKIQGTSWSGGAIQVVYSAPQGIVVVNSYTPGTGWSRRGGPWTVRFQPGDQFGARALPDGRVRVFRNGLPIGEASLGAWPFAAGGGRIGLKLYDATATRIGLFGGGNARVNIRPQARILAPIAPAFYASGRMLPLSATATDEEPAANLAYRWSLFHGSNQLLATAATRVDSIAVPPGVAGALRVRLIATDSGGLSDTANVSIHPEIDLVPASVMVTPELWTSPAVTPVSVVLRNRGRMPSPPFHWMLLADGVAVAQGDTSIAALDSVRVAGGIPAAYDAGAGLRVVVDSLGAIVETDETNNALVQRWTAPFPTTPVLDAFSSTEGQLGAPWAGSLPGLQVVERALVPTASSSYATWNGAVFGTDQEAFLRFDAITATAPEHDLLLKVQGTSWTAGAIQVVYSAPQARVVVNTYTPGLGWTRRGGPWTVRFQPGDQFGARALPDGRVRVYRNGLPLGETTLGSWPFASTGGRIGVIVLQANASRIGLFGGGTTGTLNAAVRASLVANLPSPNAAVEALVPRLDDVPARLALSSARPNPSSGNVFFTLELPRNARVSLSLFDVNGRRVWSSRGEDLAAGRRTMHWPGIDSEGAPAAPGLYLAHVVVEGKSLVRRVTLIR